MPFDQRAVLTVAAIDNANRAELCLRESRWPLLAKLHGDFQSVELKNTQNELKEQDSKMRTVLTTACTRFGLVAVGYSGRDTSVMGVLSETLSRAQSFPAGIFRVTQPSQSILPAVTEFLEAATNAGISVTIVEVPTFDELAGDLVDSIDLPPVLQNHVQQSRPQPVLSNVPFTTQEKLKFLVLQCSAIPIIAIAASSTTIQNWLVAEPKTYPRLRKYANKSILADVPWTNTVLKQHKDGNNTMHGDGSGRFVNIARFYNNMVGATGAPGSTNWWTLWTGGLLSTNASGVDSGVWADFDK